jgi:hypothetical protein
MAIGCAYLPSNAGGTIWGAGKLCGGHQLGPWTGFAVLCGYAVVLTGLAAAPPEYAEGCEDTTMSIWTDGARTGCSAPPAARASRSIGNAESAICAGLPPRRG